MSRDHKRDRERAELQAEMERLSALQDAGKLPRADTGGLAPLSFAAWLIDIFSPVPKPVSGKTPAGEYIN